jgi:hypothetical protein
MQTAQTALHLAADADADLVTAQTIESAISEWS